MKPVGIGNSASELDLSVLVAPSVQDEGSGPKDLAPTTPSEHGDDDNNKTQLGVSHMKTKHSASVVGLDISKLDNCFSAINSLVASYLIL